MAVNVIYWKIEYLICKRELETDWTMRDHMHMALDSCGI